MDELKLCVYAFLMPVAFILSLVISFFILRALPQFKVKESRKPVRPELGGCAVTAGLLIGIFFSIGFISYSGIALARLPLLGSALTLLLIAFISLIDDFYLALRPQYEPLTLLLPGLVLALAFIEAGKPSAGPASQSSAEIVLSLILIPVGIAGASFLTNRMEAPGDLGMGVIAVASLGGVAFLRGELLALLTLVSGFGALLAALYYGFNKSAKELIGNVGTYSLGALIAIAAVIGNFELAGIIVLLPYLLGFVLRVRSRSLGQLTTSLSRRALAFTLMGIEAIFGVLAITLYGGW